jgi:hypothetical protein
MTTQELYELITGEKMPLLPSHNRKWATVRLAKLEDNDLIEYNEQTKKWHSK